MSEFTQVIEGVAVAFGLLGVGVIVGGLAASVVISVRVWRKSGPGATYASVRRTFGRSILLGLEVLVAGDIIRTVALEPTLGNLAVLGVLVAIRTFLAWSLEVEIDGRWPWTRARDERECASG